MKPSPETKFKWPVQFVVRKESGDAEAGLFLQASLVSQGLREIVAGLVPQASMVRLGLRDHRDLKVLKEFRDHLNLKVIRALKDPRAILESEDDEAGLVPQGSMVRPGLREHMGLKVLKEIRGLLDLKAIRALKDPRAILVNPSQLLLLCHLWYLWW